MSNLNNAWLTENPMFKNKNQKYHYDFGTGKQIEREDVKKEREALCFNFDLHNHVTSLRL